MLRARKLEKVNADKKQKTAMPHACNTIQIEHSVVVFRQRRNQMLAIGS
jgi:hypothetical protein